MTSRRKWCSAAPDSRIWTNQGSLLQFSRYKPGKSFRSSIHTTSTVTDPERLEVLIVDFSHAKAGSCVGRGERSSTRSLRSSLLTSFLKFDKDSAFPGVWPLPYVLGTSCSVLTLLLRRRYADEVNISLLRKSVTAAHNFSYLGVSEFRRLFETFRGLYKRHHRTEVILCCLEKVVRD